MLTSINRVAVCELGRQVFERYLDRAIDGRGVIDDSHLGFQTLLFENTIRAAMDRFDDQYRARRQGVAGDEFRS